MQHLRRFAKDTDLSPAVVFAPAFPDVPISHVTEEYGSVRTPRSDVSGQTTPGPTQTPILYFLVCAVSSISNEHWLHWLSSLLSLPQPPETLHCRIVKVPRYAPASEEQAKSWSDISWPTVFRKNNPFGPDPSILLPTEKRLAQHAGQWMNLAYSAARESQSDLFGEPIGAVVVANSGQHGSQPVVVAGDARWYNVPSVPPNKSGNIMAHAVMRAIDLVACKRRQLLDFNSPESEEGSQTLYGDNLLTSLERSVFSKSTLSPGGYLCLDLEIFVTHEPCIMCSMAILHSRFGKVVFGQRQPSTGGLTADSRQPNANYQGLGYGLFWRPELNWKLLAWQWLDDEPAPLELSSRSTHV